MSDNYDNVTFLPFGKNISDEPPVDQKIMEKLENNIEAFDASTECEGIARGLLLSVSAAIEDRIDITNPEEFRKCMSAISCLTYGALMQQKQVRCAEVDLVQDLVSALEGEEK